MIRIRPMTLADLKLALGLSRQAGWNQTEADWRRLLALQPDGGFVAEWNNTPVGTTMTTLFETVAWVSMVLVDKSVRGRGIGKALVTHALDFLDDQGAKSVRLDATALGLPLYQSLGFVEQFQLTRFEGTLPGEHDQSRDRQGAVESVPQEGWEELAALDQAVTLTDRRRLLFRLFAEQPQNLRRVRRNGRITGYVTARPGALATNMGPCCAVPEAGPLLFADAWRRFAGQRIFLDIPVANTAATKLAEAQGLTVQRAFRRMCRGIPLQERVENLWASAGPEKG